MSRAYSELRVGLIGLGLQAYWGQFPGLHARLQGYLATVERKIAAEGRRIVNFGLVDSHDSAVHAGHACRVNDCDILVVYVTTYSLSQTLLPVIRISGIPVLFLNLQPVAAIDYATFNSWEDRTKMTGEWLAYCSSCPVPEFANVLRRVEIPFRQVMGMLENDPECWEEIDGWLQAAGVVKRLGHARLGLMGHYYSGMLDISTDLALLSGKVGIQIEQLEVDELTGLRRGVTNHCAREKLQEFRSFFEIMKGCSDHELERAARTAVALDAFASRNMLDVLAYYHKGAGTPENEETMSSIILGASILTAGGVPVAGEYEVKNAIAMKILDELDAGGSFTEYYAVDFNDDVVLMGHDGPGHIRIAEGRIKVRPLSVYHGKVGNGLSVEMSVRRGPVTLLSVIEDRAAGFALLVAEAESVPGQILEIGNTNSRYRFPLGARKFVEGWNQWGPAHHCAVGIGHLAGKLEKVADLLGLPMSRVC